MKSPFFYLVVIGLILLCHEVFGDELHSIVQNEIQIAQNEADSQLRQASDRLARLRSMKERAILQSKKQAEVELSGKKLMDKYAMLLAAKYRNEKEEFEPGNIISEKDQENIGKLFKGYLYSQPLTGQTSAGEAKRILEIGSKSLDEMAKMHLNPTEKNNSQLEIIEYQAQLADAMLKKASNLAIALGMPTKSGIAPKQDRVPATKK